MNGLTFNGEGPMMSGTWYNPNTGDSFTVADSFFQDNQYLVKTTDGRMLDYNFIQHYVKSDKPIPKMTQPKKQESLPAEVANLIAPQEDMLDDDLDLISGKKLGNLGVYQPLPVGVTYDNPNKMIIDKALSKRPIPIVMSTIEWMQFPRKELDMLMDVMDVDRNEILEWYMSKLDLNAIKESIKCSLNEYFNSKFEPIKEDDSEVFGLSGYEEVPIEPIKATKPKNKLGRKKK